MSKYTTEVRYICEQAAGLEKSEGYKRIPEIIQAAIPMIFDFDFPVWKEEKRNDLETKILMHYYTREIGFETVGLWKLKLCEKLNLIMPYYNRLYEQVEKINPLDDTDLYRALDKWQTDQEDTDTTRQQYYGSKNVLSRDTMDTRTPNLTDTESGTVDTDTSGMDKTTKDDWRKINDTPQGAITGLATDAYITSAEHDTADDKVDRTDTTNEERDLTYNHRGTETTAYTGSDTTTNDISDHHQDNVYRDRTGHGNDQEHTWGKSPGKSFSEMFKEYLEYVRNIDEMVIAELNELFMLIY